MYHPKKYKEHNESLIRFVNKFNMAAKDKGNILKMYHQRDENFREDGGIEWLDNNNKILYDYEKRFTYYNCCGAFKFESLGQFERKICKPEIKLSIQCSKAEDCFLIAWHDDYYKETQINIGSVKGAGGKEYTMKRFTKDFIELSYNQFDLFHDILLFAFKNNEFNKRSFSAIN